MKKIPEAFANSLGCFGFIVIIVLALVFLAWTGETMGAFVGGSSDGFWVAFLLMFVSVGIGFWAMFSMDWKKGRSRLTQLVGFGLALAIPVVLAGAAISDNGRALRRS